MTIDNFDIFRQHITFEKARKFDPNSGNIETINDTYDRYIVQIIQRAKDLGGKHICANTSSRLLKTYEISSLEYFDKKREHIIEICKANSARAYILPQVRSTYDCLKEMIKIGVDNLENPTIKFHHILRSCMCSMHKSRDKKWILDLDDDCMVEHIVNGDEVIEKKWTVNDVLALVKKMLIACGKPEDAAYVVKTKSGHHIVSSPFDLQKAYKECSMLYEGQQVKTVGVKHTGPGEFEFVSKKTVGWLHKDGMSLLYFSDEEM